jgi:hypothetical protein
MSVGDATTIRVRNTSAPTRIVKLLCRSLQRDGDADASSIEGSFDVTSIRGRDAIDERAGRERPTSRQHRDT